jgi:hypothetical protein
VALKLTGVALPLGRQCVVTTDHVAPAKGFSSRFSLPVSHACVRTCISELEGTPESVVRDVGADYELQDVQRWQ